MGDGGSGSSAERAPAMKLGRRRVALAFMLVGLGALATTLVAVAQTRELQAGARELAANMLTSVRLLGRLESQVRKRRILVDDHIFAQTHKEMASLEGQIATVDGEIADTIGQYQAWATLPGEGAVWERTQRDLAALAPVIERALQLSRENRDAEARREMDQVATPWALVGQDLDTLIDINDRGAADSLARFSSIRRRLMLLLLGLGGAGVVGTALAGRWAARQVARREVEMLAHAAELESRNRDLDAFAGRVAHDVRGPLTTMKLALPSLAKKLPKDDRTLDILGRGVARMEALVEDLLTLARVETLAHGRCDPAAVVAEVQADFASRIEAERGALRVSVAHAEVSCSDGLLRQAVTNLVENAVKYRRPETAPEVEISGGAADGGYDLLVSDNGVGLSEEEALQVFRPFYRSPRIRDRPGTGLGLSIVNRVVEASGGRLSVRSALGSGSTFVVHLPLAGAAAAGEGGRGP